jgi:hypothetical protein
MSRPQETKTFNTAEGQNTGYYNNAQNSYSNAQQDADNFDTQLASYAGQNPYGAGGAFQTTTNQQLTNTADSGAQSAGNALQEAALRTGQSVSGAVGATETMEQQNERNLSGQEAASTQQRIAADAAYNQSVLNATATPVAQQTTLAGQQGNLADATLNTQEKAASTPSWEDEFGSAVASGLGKGIGRA